MDTDIKHNETSSLPATVSPSPVIHPASTQGKAMSTNSGSASGVDVGSVVEQAVTSSSNAQPATAAAVGDIKTSSNGAASTQETDNLDAEASGKPSGAPEAAEPPVQTLSTTTQDCSLPDGNGGEAKPDGQVTKDDSDDSAKNDELSDNIQEGYVLVAHPDGTVPQALNKDSAPPLEGLSEHITEGEDGQEVEHFDPNTPPARIQAYARLEFPFFNFYIQKLSVTIGRRPPVSRSGSIPPSAVAATAGSSEKILSHESTSMQDAGEVLLDGVKAPLDEVKTSHGNSSGEVDGTIKVKEEEEEEEKDGVPSLSHSSMPESQRHPAVKVEDISVQQKSDQWGAPVASTSGAGAPSASARSVAADNVQDSTVAATPTGDAVADRTSVEPGPSCVPEVPMTVDSAEASAGPSRQTKDAKAQVDVDLGPIKAVSRDHARLFFDNTINPRSGLTNGWSLEVRGRNGLVLDGKWRAKGEISRLKNGSRIQIAERIFHFVLPNGVPYPTAPPSPVMDEYFDGHSQNYGYPLTPDGSGSPIVYGSDSDELRSDNDDEFGYGYDDDDMDADGPNGSPSIGSGPLLDENGNSIKRKRGRPKKQRTAEQLAALELERQKRLDPSIPRRPRGRPPKHKKDDSIGGEMELSIPSKPLPDIPVPPTPDIPVPQLPHIPTSNSTELPIQVFQPIMPIAERPPPPALPQIDSDEPRLSKKQQAELKRAEKQRLKDEKTAQREKEKAEREAAKQAAKEAKAREVAEKKRKEEERKKAAAEEAKRIQEEKARNAEREKAEKEKQKAAAAAAAAEAKAKSQAEAKAKADAEAKAKAEAAAKAKPSSVATPTEKATPTGMASGEAKPSVAGTASPQIQSGAIPATVLQPSAKPAGATASAVAGPSNAPALTSGVQTSSIAVSTPTHVPMPVAAKKTAPPKPQAQHPPKPAPPQQRHVPQQAKPQQINVPTPEPFVPTNQFQGRPDKPPYSYPALIAQAIYSTPNKQATLQHIHMWIPDKYPFFREQTNAQILAQAIKQNLAVNRAFVNIPLPTGIALWAIETEQAKFFDGNTFLPPPNAQQVPYYAAQQAQQQQQHQGSPMPAYHPQHQQQYQQHQPHMSPVPIQPYPQHPQQSQHHHPSTASPAPLAVSPTRYQNGSMVSASPAPLVAPQSAAAHMPARATPQPTPVPSASSSSSSSSKIPILIARPPPTYVKPTPPISAAATDPSSMVDNEGYPPLVIHDAKMHLSPTVFSSLTAQQLSNLQTIDTKQALNILQAFVVNYFKTELKKRKKAEKAAAKAGTATPMSASPSPAPAHGTKRSAPDDPTNFEAVKVQKVS